MKANQLIRNFRAEQSIGPVRWYFTTPCVRYGVAKDAAGKLWRFCQDKVQNRVTGRPGAPEHFSMTPRLARGLRKAMAEMK